jgi:cytochrome c551/c552
MIPCPPARPTILLALLVAAACGKEPDGAPAPTGGAGGAPPMFGAAPPPSASPAEEALVIWRSGCMSCHGARGRGDGSVAARLTPPPRDHSDPAWQASVTDEQIAQVIVQGGAGIGRSASMPARPDLADRPEVLAELVRLIRRFGSE